MEFILAPPVAFLIYLLLVGIISGLGRLLANGGEPAAEQSPEKTSTYASGEVAPLWRAAPGYRSLAYLVGLILALVALILG
jgi:hypothetical protein